MMHRGNISVIGLDAARLSADFNYGACLAGPRDYTVYQRKRRPPQGPVSGLITTVTARSSLEAGAMKPDPAIFPAAERQFELDAKTMVFIDDIARNAEGASQCGWQGMHHTNSQAAREQSRRLGVILKQKPKGMIHD